MTNTTLTRSLLHGTSLSERSEVQTEMASRNPVARPEEYFRLAPMSPVILILTIGLLALPVVFLASAIFNRLFTLPALLLVAIYVWVWLRFRPTRFVVHPAGLDVEWPCKRRVLGRDTISAVRLVEARDLGAETGWCVRVGAGGLWGGFGWLWTARRGIVQMYVSRTDRFVWIERVNARPWLITPEQPEAFVRVLGAAIPYFASPPRRR
jgi:hypothetical protein